MTELKVSIQGQGLYLIINRPHKGNSLHPSLVEGLAENVTRAAHNPQLKYIYLGGEGKNFCTGADLDWLSSLPTDHPGAFASFEKMYKALLDCDLPLVAKVQGHICGGGLGLTALCDIVACEETAVFSLPEVQRGLIPGIITPLLLRKIGASSFTRYALTGADISATQAQDMQLVHFTGAAEETAAFIHDTCQNLTQAPVEALRRIKQSIRYCQKALDKDLESMTLWSSQMLQNEALRPLLNRGQKKKG